MLTNRDLSEDEEERSAFELRANGVERVVSYNPVIPIETFDLIIVDECHPSIYSTSRQVLAYFDAFIVGLTSARSPQTLGFFGNNVVAQYPCRRSVADGVTVDYEVYRVRADIGAQAGEVPKTLIFAKDDDHAEDVVDIVREAFGGNEIAAKIAYRQHGADPEQLIRRFRTDHNPRLAVTADMIATGTDLRPLEALIFLRDVKSALLLRTDDGPRCPHDQSRRVEAGHAGRRGQDPLHCDRCRRRRGEVRSSRAAPAPQGCEATRRNPCAGSGERCGVLWRP
jgi:type I restriction enzyme, R subunit